ncbi:MAG: nickel-dependent lactate racemase [Planctomycetes bacterium]|nr:nickel-dependent lactate racemase [Planctomycetota bacterium]
MVNRTVDLRFGAGHATLRLPEGAEVLRGPVIPAVADPRAAVREALDAPIAAEPLRELAARKRPRSVVVTMSDITRPVPNELLITAILDRLAEAGIPDSACTILIATGMHRPSTERERRIMLGDELLRRCRVVDHEADRKHTLVRVADDPPVSVNRIYVEAELKIVTGLIEPHFMAGYSGGRKGICPGLVDLETVQRFHGHRTMGDPAATEGRMVGNPCHVIGMQVALQVGCDFLVNAAITHERELAGVFAGDLVEAHEAGCRQVEAWTAAHVAQPFDLVVQSAGGYPLDESFYQTVKGMVTALPALHERSVLLMCSACTEVGSPEYTDLMLRLGNDHRAFLAEIAQSGRTAKDQWQFQMQTRVLERIGVERLLLANDGLPLATQQRLGVTPLEGDGAAIERVQRFVDEFARQHPDARIAVIPEGPYTMLRR